MDQRNVEIAVRYPLSLVYWTPHLHLICEIGSEKMFSVDGSDCCVCCYLNRHGQLLNGKSETMRSQI